MGDPGSECMGKRLLTRRLAVVVAAMLVALGAGCSAAWADGDPASDVLLSQVAFLPSDAGLSPAQEGQLTGLLRAAARAGAPLRVAVIPNSYDLGSITELWKKPETYARFLGAELSLVYKHPLLVVMPNGLGLNWPGHSVSSAKRELANVRVQPGPAGLLDGALTGVRRVLSTEHAPRLGTAPSPPPASPSPSDAKSQSRSAGSDRLAVILAATAAVLFLMAALAYYVLRVRLPVKRRRGNAEHRLAATASASWVRGWLPVGMLLCVVAVGAPILAVSLLRGSSAGATADRSSSGTPYTLPEGRQRAPAFTLRTQNGDRLSLSSFRGRDVLITFVDPLCRNLCPLEAHVLNALVDQLPARQRPAIVAVSVDPWADSRHDLQQDFTKWSLVPQWHWAVGSRAQLRSVWKRFAISVQVVTKTLAGTTVHYITHTEASYLIDPAGYERALFVWPFSARDVLTTLRRVSSS